MRAVAIRPGQARSAHLADLPRPGRAEEQYLVRVLEVGTDGTDNELDSGTYGEALPESDLLVLGHESLGDIAEECPGVECFARGDLVVATGRRPCPEQCLHCRNGEYDRRIREALDQNAEAGLKAVIEVAPGGARA
jgi:threonine dehydrogenase-like Zn-dependent dehydrogenase